MTGKVKSLEELALTVTQAKKAGRKVAQCHGVFDLLHPGHIRHFQAARKEADLLVVTLTADHHTNKGPGRPVFNERLRAESIAALQCVDYVAINPKPTAIDAIRLLRPDLYVKGSDYSDASGDLTGNISLEREAIESVGGRIFFTDDIAFSSTELLNNYFDVYPGEAQAFLKEFKTLYRANDVIGRFSALKGLKVLVIGETIIDQYHYCKGIGKPLKDSILATQYMSEEAFAGGTLACANHIAGFVDEVHLVTALGNDPTENRFVRRHLKPNVKPYIFNYQGPSIIKRRFVDVAFLNKLFEVCYLTNEDTLAPVVGPIQDRLRNLKDYDLVLVTDFGHGLFTPPLVTLLSERARFLAVNAQTNSGNAGFNMITKYPRADYFCIDEPELRLAAHDRTAPLEDLIPKIAQKLHCLRATITRGHQGSITYSRDGQFYKTPIFSTKIVDRTGAGDAYLSLTSLCVASQFPPDLVGFIGNAVGAMAVQIVCNRSSVEPVPLFKFITALLQ